MTVENHAHLSPSQLASIEDELRGHKTLLDVINWGQRQTETRRPQVVADVVSQDEFTHDCIVPWRAPLFLVYDTT